MYLTKVFRSKKAFFVIQYETCETIFLLFIQAKNQLKASILLELESGAKAVQLLGSQAALTGSALSPCEISAAVDSVTIGDVRNVSIRFEILKYFFTPLYFQALQKAGKKLTIASVGNLVDVPYADDLK